MPSEELSQFHGSDPVIRPDRGLDMDSSWVVDHPNLHSIDSSAHPTIGPDADYLYGILQKEMMDKWIDYRLATGYKGKMYDRDQWKQEREQRLNQVIACIKKDQGISLEDVAVSKTLKPYSMDLSCGPYSQLYPVKHRYEPGMVFYQGKPVSTLLGFHILGINISFSSPIHAIIGIDHKNRPLMLEDNPAISVRVSIGQAVPVEPDQMSEIQRQIQEKPDHFSEILLAEGLIEEAKKREMSIRHWYAAQFSGGAYSGALFPSNAWEHLEEYVESMITPDHVAGILHTWKNLVRPDSLAMQKE